MAGKQTLITLRHALRQDELDQGEWAFTAERPWDPPLSDEGKKQAAKAGTSIAGLNVALDFIVTSPFLRCLQTTSAVLDGLPEPKPHVEVDCSLCEVLSTAFLAGQGPEKGQSIRSWMWQGKDLSQAWANQIGKGDASYVDLDFPAFPETFGDAHIRYTEALQRAADRHLGKNILVVTHGEAVGKSVTRLLPYVSVYSVDHCGYTVAWRPQDAAGEWENWHLEDKGGSTGVHWSKR